MKFDYSGDAKPPDKPPDGIAALNSGLVAVATVTERTLSDTVGTASVYIVDPDTGEIVDRGPVHTDFNDDWLGEDHVWVRYATPGFQSWV